MEAYLIIMVKLTELEPKLANISYPHIINCTEDDFSGPYLRCVHPKKVQGILFELHEGRCGSHTGGRSLTPIGRGARAIGGITRKYMLWLTPKSVTNVKKHAPIIHQPGTKLHPLLSLWPFAQWGLDILRLFFEGFWFKKVLTCDH